MPDLETIRRLTIQAKTEGVGEAKDQLNQLADAQKKVGDASGVTATVTDTAARSQLSAAQAYNRLRSQIDENYRAQQKITGGQAVLDQALKQGVISTEDHARGLDLLNKRYALVDPAAQKVATSLGEQRRAIKTLVAEMSLAGAAAAYRMEQEALLRAQIQGINLSDAQKQRLHDLAQAYGEAAQKVDNLRKAQAAANALSSTLVDGLFDVVTGAKTASQEIRDVSNSILKMVMQGVLAGQGPLAGLFGTDVSGGVFGSLFKGLFGALKFHEGGVVGEESSSRLSRAMQSSIVVPASVIPTLPRYHSGLAPDERLAVLQTGEEVRSRAQVQADKRKKRTERDERSISIYAPMTIIAPDPPKFNNSRGQLARTVGTAWKQANRFM
jgi:hypothetical protein